MATRPTSEQLERSITENLSSYRAQPRADFGIGPGWFPLVGDLDRRLTELAGASENYRYTQIKQKFAGLRCYVSINVELPEDVKLKMREAVAATEKLSSQTCEDCSQPGSYRGTRSWKVTLCDDCETDREAKRAAARAERAARRSGQ